LFWMNNLGRQSRTADTLSALHTYRVIKLNDE